MHPALQALLAPVVLERLASCGYFSSWKLTIRPDEECGNELQNLEFLRVRAIKGEEMKEVIRDNLPKGLSFALFF